MECRVYTESLTALMDGELAAEEAGAIQAHLRVCRSCDAEYHSLRYSYDLVSKARLIESQPAAWTVIRSRIEAPPERRRFLLDFLFPNRWVPITALAGLVLVVTSLFLLVPSENRAVALREVLEKYAQERDREFQSKGALTQQGIGTVRVIHYNPFADTDSSRKGNPFKAE